MKALRSLNCFHCLGSWTDFGDPKKLKCWPHPAREGFLTSCPGCGDQLWLGKCRAYLSSLQFLIDGRIVLRWCHVVLVSVAWVPVLASRHQIISSVTLFCYF